MEEGSIRIVFNDIKPVEKKKSVKAVLANVKQEFPPVDRMTEEAKQAYDRIRAQANAFKQKQKKSLYRKKNVQGQNIAKSLLIYTLQETQQVVQNQNLNRTRESTAAVSPNFEQSAQTSFQKGPKSNRTSRVSLNSNPLTLKLSDKESQNPVYYKITIGGLSIQSRNPLKNDLDVIHSMSNTPTKALEPDQKIIIGPGQKIKEKSVKDHTKAITQVALKAVHKKMSNEEIKNEILIYLSQTHQELRLIESSDVLNISPLLSEKREQLKGHNRNISEWSALKASQLKFSENNTLRSSRELQPKIMHTEKTPDKAISLPRIDSKKQFELNKRKIIQNVQNFKPIIQRFQRFDQHSHAQPPSPQKKNNKIGSKTFETEFTQKVDVSSILNSTVQSADEVFGKHLVNRNSIIRNRELYRQSICNNELKQGKQKEKTHKLKSQQKEIIYEALQRFYLDKKNPNEDEIIKRLTQASFKNHLPATEFQTEDKAQDLLTDENLTRRLIQSNWSYQNSRRVSLDTFKLNQLHERNPEIKTKNKIPCERKVGALASKPEPPTVKRSQLRNQQLSMIKNYLRDDDHQLFQNIHLVTNLHEPKTQRQSAVNLPILIQEKVCELNTEKNKSIEANPSTNENRPKIIEISGLDIFNKTFNGNSQISSLKHESSCKSLNNSQMLSQEKPQKTSYFRQPSIRSDSNNIKLVSASAIRSQVQTRNSVQALQAPKPVIETNQIDNFPQKNVTMFSFSPESSSPKQKQLDPMTQRENLFRQLVTHQESFKQLTQIGLEDMIKTRNDKMLVLHEDSNENQQQSIKKHEKQVIKEQPSVESISFKTPQILKQNVDIKSLTFKQQPKAKITPVQNRRKQDAEDILGFSTFLEVAKSRPIRIIKRTWNNDVQ